MAKLKVRPFFPVSLSSWAKPELTDFWVPRSSFHHRSELPSHASWSNDASLLAVAAGSFVPIYDSATNVLLQVLVASECGRVSSVHFLGSIGRFLAVAGERDLVLWDLVSQTSTDSNPLARPPLTITKYNGTSVL